jgi:Tol biopolymer transport system component
MTIKKFLILVIILLAGTSITLAQSIGFNMTNERNKPHINWISAETEHFIITYPDYLAGIEAEVAAIAEETYTALSANLNVTFDYKIRIYLSDEDEIINGYAVPFPRAYTNIWVNLNDFAMAWTGPEKWLRTVVAHELAHIFHFEAVRSNVPLIGILGIAPSMPEPWTEGIAQYYTEPWHATRGDLLLRRAFYDGRPSHRDGSSPLNGGLMYAAGNSQLRYFTELHGDSTVAKILAHRDSVLFKRVHWHNFKKAFKDVTDQSFAEFEDEWRRHMNIYYHTLAGQMERSDSLGVKPLEVPGYFISQVAYSPDTTQIAVIGIDSAERPVSRLVIVANDSTRKERVLHEGSLSPTLSWSPDGTRLAYAAVARGEFGSLINDIYVIDVESGHRERITRSRRATRPVWSNDGSELVYVVNENGTGNLFRLNLETRTETRLTNYTGDSQIGALAMHPAGTHLAYALFASDGSRKMALLDLSAETSRYLTNPALDDRNPVWSPDGTLLAYTSLRDYVPNIFVIDPFAANPAEERITAMFAGALAWQWLPADSLNEAGTLVLASSDTKRDMKWYRVDASRRHHEPQTQVNPSYTRWLTRRPDHALPVAIAPDETLVTDRYKYNSFRNISHVATLPLPYYSSEEGDFGALLISLWSEPLGKHMITGVGALSATNFTDNSLIFASYLNNQFRASWNLSAYHNSFTGRIYERDFLVTTNSGAYLLGTLPRDWIDSPFMRTNLYTRLRYEYTDAERLWDAPLVPSLPAPESGWQSDLRVGIRMHKQKPHAHNLIHPLDGRGFEFRTTLATTALGGETSYLRPDFKGYALLPGGGMNRFYLYGRAIAQSGDSFAQDYIGFSRFDDIQFGGILEGMDFLYADAERVRGFSDYVTGKRLIFGTLEYRMPLFDDLDTRLLGIVSLGRTTLSAFVDGGVVWTDGLTPGDDAVSRAGAGAELKNVLTIGGLSIVHSLGLARPVQDISSTDTQEVYYRIKAVIPF